jgi:hypothetical protein
MGCSWSKKGKIVKTLNKSVFALAIFDENKTLLWQNKSFSKKYPEFDFTQKEVNMQWIDNMWIVNAYPIEVPNIYQQAACIMKSVYPLHIANAILDNHSNIENSAMFCRYKELLKNL